MPRPARKVVASLLRKGFRRRDNDHIYLQLWVDGRKTIIGTKVSHGEREIADNLLGLMARQLRLGSQGFRDLLECPLSGEGYVRILPSLGVLS